MESYFLPIVITFFAGISTVLGALFVKRVRNTSISAFFLAFATGIMLMLALGELFNDALEGLGVVLALVFLVVGAMLTLVLDLILPHHHDHEKEKSPGHYISDCECAHEHTISYGMVVALVLHNILEGIAVGVTAVSDVRLGLNMALGIAIHNIPIGTTLAVSMFSAGKSKNKVIIGAVLVGLSQPLGSVLGTVILYSFIDSMLFSVLSAVVAGILLFVAFDELWPVARKSGSRNLTIIALLIGICFVPLSELLLG